MEETWELTDDVKRMLGDPKKALLAMAIPMIVATIVQSMNNIIDAIWVSGISTAALAATGVAFPYFFIVMGVSNGLGAGASQALGRRLGAQDYEGTHRVASQTFVMSLLGAIVLTVVLSLLVEPLMAASGAEDYLSECLEYALPLFLGIPAILMSGVISALLRSEGASKRSMMIQLLAAGMNMVLDPIFIYVFGWGIGGAALATVVSMAVSTIVGLYWYFVSKSTFVRIPLRGFRFDRQVDRDILKVGIPASMEMIVMSLVCLVLNWIIVMVDPVDGLAIYSTGWRALDLLMIPAMAFGFSLVPICAAAYGAGKLDKLRQTFGYGLKFGTATMLIMTLFTLVAAPLIVALFTYSDATKDLAPGMILFLRISALFLPVITVEYASSGLFQSLGMGTRSLVVTLVMNLLRIPICSVLIGFGELSLIWYGITVSEIIGAFIIGLWALRTLRGLDRRAGITA